MQTFENFDKLEENVHYELIPSDGENWDVRMLEGPFPETVVSFNDLKMTDDEGTLSFNFDLVTTPDPSLNEENVELQRAVAAVLNSILETAVPRIHESLLEEDG